MSAIGFITTAQLSRRMRSPGTIVRVFDSARTDLVPKCTGLLVASLGYSHTFKDDLSQLKAATALYDAYIGGAARFVTRGTTGRARNRIEV